MLAKTKGKHSDKYLLTHQYLPLRSPLRRILQTWMAPVSDMELLDSRATTVITLGRWLVSSAHQSIL